MSWHRALSHATVLAIVLSAVVAQRVAARHTDGCPDVIIEAFGAVAHRACQIAWCESPGWDNEAIGRAGEVSTWQVHPIWFSIYERQRLIDDMEYATMAALEISRQGTDWSPWSCSRV